jgi:arabinofuranosyltransferase
VSSPFAAIPDGASFGSATPRLIRAALLIFFTYIFLANAWVGDDAHITFRTVWNAIHGYGLTYNPDERVQAYTDPLWMMTVGFAHFVTREFYFTVLALSWAFTVAAGALLVKRAGTLANAALAICWVLSSKALVDYSSSGLEYPLAYFLLVLFYTRYLEPSTPPATERDLRVLVFIASLGFVTRIDMALLFALPLIALIWKVGRARGGAMLRSVAIGALPAILWVLFATFYYGFPLPNTYYAKVANGIPSWLQRQQGWAYLFNSISHDPITLGTVVLALLVGWRTSSRVRMATLSALLYVAYTVWAGGDFMSGRFFAMPFLVGAVVLAPVIERPLIPWAAAALVLYNVFVPVVPIKTQATYDGAWPWRSQNGIKDERGHTHQASNILKFAAFRTLPDTPFAREGISFSAAPEHARVYCCIGQYGLNAGPAKHIIDDNALADPLLARLPVSPRVYFDFWMSHYFRDIPEGYIESNEQDRNLLTDPLLREYYDRLRNVTRGSLLRASRLRDIWALNVRYPHLHEDYEKRRPIALSMLAGHERFLTDVGVRNPAATTLQSVGNPGYLQYGPNIPLRQGFYRARWVARVDDAGNGQLGFVEIWNGTTRINRQPVIFTPPAQDQQRIAHLDFTLTAPARSIEYRFYVNAGVRLLLQRVELFSGLGIPREPPGE